MRFPEKIGGGEGVKATLRIKNIGDVPWFRNGGHSNMVGKILFHFDLVKELCFWFEEKGSTPVEGEIEFL